MIEKKYSANTFLLNIHNSNNIFDNPTSFRSDHAQDMLNISFFHYGLHGQQCICPWP